LTLEEKPLSWMSTDPADERRDEMLSLAATIGLKRGIIHL
jgi:hypothetical protein